MSDNSTIEWTDATWNPVTGCTKVSPGCDHCYAETFAERWRGLPGHYFEQGFDVVLRPDKLTLPLKWRKPKRVFVNSMSDLFHDSVPDEYIARVFAVMAATPQHTYQILTKRHGRMRSLLTDECRCGAGHAPGVHFRSAMAWAATSHSPTYVPGLKSEDLRPLWDGTGWPLPNVWLGVSVEDQKRADLRIPALLDTPAAVRFLSCEPLLGEVDLAGWVYDRAQATPPIGWVIVGGESGHGARPMQPDWARSLRDQCTAAGVSFFFKQWGAYRPGGHPAQPASWVTKDGQIAPHLAGTSHTVAMSRVSKKDAGRDLDGRTWDEYPQAVTR